MKITAGTIPDLRKHDYRPVIRVIQVLMCIVYLQRTVYAFYLLTEMISIDYEIPAYFIARLVFYLFVGMALVYWLFHPYGKVKENTDAVMLETEFMHTGKNDAYKYHAVCIHQADGEADYQYLLPIAEKISLVYDSRHEKLTLQCKKCVRQRIQNGNIIDTCRLYDVKLVFFVREKQAEEIGMTLDGYIRGLHGSDQEMPLMYQAEETKTEDGQNLYGDMHAWMNYHRPMYRKAMQECDSYRALRRVMHVYIPLAAACTLLDYFLTGYLSHQDVQRNPVLMMICLVIETGVLPLYLRMLKNGPSEKHFVSRITVSGKGIRGQYFHRRVIEDTDEPENENIRKMTERETLWIPFQDGLKVTYDASRHNLLFCGDIVQKKENAFTDAGKERAETVHLPSYTLHDCYTPSLAAVLREYVPDMQEGNAEINYRENASGMKAGAYVLFAGALIVCLCIERYISVWSPVIACVLIYLCGKKKA